MTKSFNNTNKAIILKPMSMEHMPKTYDWISDPKFRKLFMVRGISSWEEHINYFENLLRDDTQQAYAMFLGDHHFGNCGLKYINNFEKSAELWIYIGNNEAKGVGLGGLALDMLLKNGINHFSLISIYVHVAENNKWAKKLYIKNGFFEYGDCSEEWKNRDVKMVKMLWRAK
jgi:UDP-4-amino-4,6-dideoxy-N-acetyl-beta-L-altrosamine N-acetyltransferase